MSQLEQLLTESDKIVNNDKRLSLFFNNSSMSRLLDVFLDNPDIYMNIENVLKVAGLSRKAIQVNMPLLYENNILNEEIHRPYKFYKLNEKSSLVKQITEFRDILLVNNVFIEKRRPTTTNRKSNKKESNRRVNTGFQKQRGRSKQSKNAQRTVQKKSTHKK